MAKAKTTDETLSLCVTAALTLAETANWGDLTLAQIGAEAGLSLEQLHGKADKVRISEAVEPGFDKAMSEGSLDADETPRTRLFDVIMMRFEAMEDKRDGVMSYLRWRDRSLSGLALRAKMRLKTARWALSCAGLDGDEKLPNSVRLPMLAWILSQAERAWRTETSADLSKTMAALDAALLKAEERAKWWNRRGKSSAQSEPKMDEASEGTPQ